MTWIVLLASVMLFACSSAVPQPTSYLLRSESVRASGRVEAPVRVGLDRIVVAPYLDQDGIVVETEAGQVTAARRHLWAEPLEAGLRSFLRSALSTRLGYEVDAGRADPLWDYSVEIYVDRLHGTLGGTAMLDATYRITPRAGESADFRFSSATPLPRDGYPGLVEAQTRLLRDLAAAIAASLRGLQG